VKKEGKTPEKREEREAMLIVSSTLTLGLTESPGGVGEERKEGGEKRKSKPYAFDFIPGGERSAHSDVGLPAFYRQREERGWGGGGRGSLLAIHRNTTLKMREKMGEQEGKPNLSISYSLD